jgi:adenylate cyclase
MQIPSFDNLAKLRASAHELSAIVETDHSPELLWTFAGNNELVSKIGGKPLTQFARLAPDRGLGRWDVKLSYAGLRQHWIEFPYEWVQGSFMQTEMVYIKGVFDYLSVGVETLAAPDGRGNIRIRLRFVPRVPLLSKALARKVLADFVKAWHKLLAVPLDTERIIEPFFEITDSVSAKADALAKEWVHLTVSPGQAQDAALFVLAAPDVAVRDLRPFEVADFYGLDRVDMLRFFLRCARTGFLDMRWALICPSCRGEAQRADHLSALPEDGGHCESCDVDFGIDFDRQVEVVFRPAQRIRALDDRSYCLGSAGNTPHVVAQWNLLPGDASNSVVSLAPGEYRIRVFYQPGEILLKVSEGTGSALALDFGAPLAKDTLEVSSPVNLTLQNSSGEWRTLKIERLAYRETAATARVVTALQEFRDLFSAEVLRPGMQLGVSNITILFSDLKDSTAMYEARGDAKAFALVQDHFDLITEVIRKNGGGIVKTIGDAVMAVFTEPQAAVAAGLGMLDAFATRNQSKPPAEQLGLKIGVHRGPCIALTLNERLDYFGSTVNRAARVQSASEAGELCLSADLFMEPAISALLAAKEPKVEMIERNLKGLAGTTTLYRLSLRETQAALST